MMSELGTFAGFGSCIGLPGTILMAMGPPSTLPNKWLCSKRLRTSTMCGSVDLTMWSLMIK